MKAVARQAGKRKKATTRSSLRPLSAGWAPPNGLSLGRYGLTGILRLDSLERQLTRGHGADSLDDFVDLICGPEKAAFRAYHDRMVETSSSKMDPFLVKCATYARQPTQGYVKPAPGDALNHLGDVEVLCVVLAYSRPRAGIVGHVMCTTHASLEHNGRDLSLTVGMPGIAVLPRFRNRGIAGDLLAGGFVVVDSWAQHVLRAAPKGCKATLDVYIEVESNGGGRLANRLSELLENQTAASLKEDFAEDGSRRTLDFQDDVD